jgi:hypothetical protein
VHRALVPFTSLAVLAAASLLAQGRDDSAKTLRELGQLGTKQPAGCGGYGTSVDFVNSPSEAAQRAKKEQKLVFVLHVSGLFEDPKLT